LGVGFQEGIYRRAFEEEIKLPGIEFKREFDMPISYKGKLIGTI